MSQSTEQRVAVNGIELSVHIAGPEQGPPIWLLHGFPECWHSWREQNWYRNFDRNWQRTEHLAGRQVLQPTLFLIGDRDPVGVFEAHTLKRMPASVPQLEQHVLANCGHWIQNEQAAQVNRLLLDFLRQR
ncbi:hypothetical protein IQK56_30670 [Pseudomonas sp. MAFF 301449]|uniref:Alpha/beta hydrolase n=1 Tax=Pseudomonas cyclaminis TaxID=2781239 RepID=A0ABR9T154_9PSED|nr:alpha/beta hydrolase [Pseudomonas cyclaminis]MBE8594905.1 hypothetical protein [Pseudomonas cyclaminis]MBE8603362.1 hypothetical protein [Pseudomonas cyclaminis]VVM75967.1 2-hydroxy-6-oxo-6-phenylhexa-2,4-dienoate hydrolase [Pseudomonas fluorescens]VVN50173.1 2-hydroxy-6-oxo-6-phenylhexa-2,4-dienoate hydrolase [Pseudomonas fluorescens]